MRGVTGAASTVITGLSQEAHSGSFALTINTELTLPPE